MTNQNPLGRRLRMLVIPSVAVLALSGCGFLTGDETSAPSDDGGGGECGETTLRLATIRADSDPTTVGANAFAEAVTEETDGQVTVDVYPNGQLGDANDLYAGLAAGENVDLFVNGISLYPTLNGAEAFNVLNVPFMWSSYDQMKAVLDSETFQTLMDEAAEATGVRIIATAGDAEPRALSANQAIETAEDMQGLLIRIADAPMPQAFATALGAEPQVIPFSDLYLSLQQGVVDAQENGAITMVNQSLMEVQSHYMPTDYIRDVQAWQVSDQAWQNLCEDHRAVIEEQAEIAGELITEEVGEQMDEAMATLEEHLTVVDVDIESFKSALEGAFDQFDGELWPEGLLAETQQLAAENE